MPAPMQRRPADRGATPNSPPKPAESTLTLATSASKAAALVDRPAGRRQRRASLRHLLILLALALSGCSLLNGYIIVPKQEIVDTPKKYHMAYRELWFKARDGVALNGWLLPGAPHRPLLVFFHGNAGNLSDNLEYLNLLHGSGFSIFIFDYRGFGKSVGEPLQENDLYQDARGALDLLHGLGWRDDRMIFFGQSLGSAVALQLALEYKPRGLVMEGSFTSMQEMVKHVSRVGYYTVAWWGMNLRYDNLAKIDRADLPLLLIHGDHDPVVPLEMTLRLFARAHQPKRLHIIANGGHCNVFTGDSAAYLAAWDSYLQTIPERTATH